MEMAITEEKKLMARSPKMEDELNYEEIRETTKKARQAMVVSEKPISQSELKSIPMYINDMIRYIKKYSSSGKTSFDYDCSKLSKACFLELASQFKHKYKEFFVVTNIKTQILTVDWSGKSEV
jgi:transposase